MEQLAAKYSTRRNGSLAAFQASAVSQTLDANQWTTLTEQQNVPGFLLLDSIRFYKKATTTQGQLAPAVETLRKESVDSKQKVDTLIQEIRTYQKRLGRVEHDVQQATKDLETMDQQVDTIRRDNLRTNSVITRNGQDVSQVVERFNVLERELMSLRAREEDTVDLRAEMHTLIVEFSAMFASLEHLRMSLAQKQVVNPQASTGIDMLSSSHDRRYELRSAMDKAPLPGPREVQPGPPAADHDSSRRQLPRAHRVKPQGKRPTITHQNRPRAQFRRQADSDFSSSFEAGFRASVDKLYGTSQPQVQQSAARAAEDDTTSESPRMEQAFDALDGDMASATLPKQTHAALMELLNQAAKNHFRYPGTSDNKLIWAFIDTIVDKALSKRLQMFLLSRFHPRLVGKSHASAQRRSRTNRFITVSKLEWPLFAQAAGEFLKSDR
ncbi:hypothetical protein BR93DRAFT_955746 [Coniochaeta sp. PMI_546]|nr:hypothetical protein BR93DRAFT_955746 [Coniochaeta sp. PMI_546]